jgi:hypothetical protein
MIDPEKEQLIPLSHAPKHPLLRRGRRAGRPIHRSTLERWRTLGVGGVKLETMKLGGIRMTSAEAIARFFDRSYDPTAPPDAPTASQIRKAHAAAESALAAAGI